VPRVSTTDEKNLPLGKKEILFVVNQTWFKSDSQAGCTLRTVALATELENAEG
jgi:hypothetical protein